MRVFGYVGLAICVLNGSLFILSLLSHFSSYCLKLIFFICSACQNFYFVYFLFFFNLKILALVLVNQMVIILVLVYKIALVHTINNMVHMPYAHARLAGCKEGGERKKQRVVCLNTGRQSVKKKLTGYMMNVSYYSELGCRTRL